MSDDGLNITWSDRGWVVTYGHRGEMSTHLLIQDEPPRVLATGRTWTLELVGWNAEDGSPRIVVHEKS